MSGAISRSASQIQPLVEAAGSIQHSLRGISASLPEAVDGALSSGFAADSTKALRGLQTQLDTAIKASNVGPDQEAILRSATESLAGSVSLIGKLKVPFRTDHDRSLSALRSSLTSVDETLGGFGSSTAGRTHSFPIPKLSAAHASTLEQLRTSPAPIRWAAVESLLSRLGARIEERAGSAIFVELNGVQAGFHRPHPSPEAHRGIVRSTRAFLKEAGVL